MNWLLLLLLAGIVFINRYIFLVPQMPVRLPKLINDALKYSAPCLLTAICGPIILGQGSYLLHANPYVYGALVSILLALIIRQIIVAIILSMLAFYIFIWVLPVAH